jgi:paraquat-inducible protein A
MRRASGTVRELPLAFAAASLLLLAIAHAQPILTIVVQGRSQQASLWEAASVLDAQGATGISALVLFTTLLAPVAEAAIALWILLPLRFGRRAPAVMPLLRLLHLVRPWVMVEIFMLGVLVATVKLSSLATIIPGAGLWAFAAAMVTIAALGQTFDTRTLWSEAAKCAPR